LRIAQAGAVLPLSANARLDKALGTRHRAAIGVTEETDAVVVVVSEERGAISLCFGGNIARDLDGATLRKALLGLFQKQKRRRTGPPKAKEPPASLAELKFERPEEPAPVVAADSPVDELVQTAGAVPLPVSETVAAADVEAAQALVSSKPVEG
jgi:diadenylate cyclase